MERQVAIAFIKITGRDIRIMERFRGGAVLVTITAACRTFAALARICLLRLHGNIMRSHYHRND